MTDEERAAQLARALEAAAAAAQEAEHPDAGTPPIPDDDFAALVRFGEDLQRRSPHIAAMARAREEFDPAFAARLKEQLLAAHPAASTARAAQPAPAHAGPAARGRLRRLLSGWRALGAVAVLAAAVLSLIILNLQHSILQPGLGGARPPATSTAQARPFAPLHHAIIRRAAPPAISPQSSRAAAGRAQPPVPAPRASAASKAHKNGPVPLYAKGFSDMAPATPTGTGFLPNVGAPMAVQPGAQPAPRYVLPAHLPELPAVAPVYAVRYQALSRQEARAIAAHFPGLAPVAGSSSPDRLRFASGGARLDVVLSTGAITYTANTGAPPAAQGAAMAPNSAPWRAAVAAARSWLLRRQLYPAGVDAPATQVFPDGNGTFVRFMPSLPGLPASAPITVQGSSATLTVALDRHGQVVSAYRLWPRVVKTGAQRLLPVTGALPAASATGAQRADTATHVPADTTVFVVSSVSLVYTPDTAATASTAAVTLRPSSYLLQGHLRTPSGPARPYSALLPATAPAPAAAPTPAAGAP